MTDLAWNIFTHIISFLFLAFIGIVCFIILCIFIVLLTISISSYIESNKDKILKIKMWKIYIYILIICGVLGIVIDLIFS